MLLHSLDLTTALRPSLLPDETLLFVQDVVGLYQGNVKIAEYQNGHAYLTSHRACYVDNEDARGKSVAVNLKDVDRSEFYAGFLKSSPKVTLHPRAAKQFGVIPRSNSNTDGTNAGPSRSNTPRPAPASNGNATWICPICTFSNPVPSNFDPQTANENTPLAPCLTCGMKPPLVTVVKAAIVGLSNRSPDLNSVGITSAPHSSRSTAGTNGTISCPRCTYDNHPSVMTCEMCGLTLKSPSPLPDSLTNSRTSSPAHGGNSDPGTTIDFSNPTESIKFSFRSGGEKIFLERLKGALVQKKWLLQSTPATSIASASTSPSRDGDGSPRPAVAKKNIGISGLERRDQEQRKNNEVVIGNAFEDLSALMASAKEIIALAEQFQKQTSKKPFSLDSGINDGGASGPSSSNLGGNSNGEPDTYALLSSLNLTTTREMLGPGNSKNATNSLYLKELARSLADFLLDDRSGSTLLRSSGGIISLVDLWAVYNRARGGVGLVSPKDFSDAVSLFKDLKLPISERVFKKSGLRVVMGSEWSDDRVVAVLLQWLRELRVREATASASASEFGSTFQSVDVAEGSDGVTTMMETETETEITWGKGITALETAEHFGWSIGVASEELEMAEERGTLCREVGVEGVRFWENWLVKSVDELMYA